MKRVLLLCSLFTVLAVTGCSAASNNDLITEIPPIDGRASLFLENENNTPTSDVSAATNGSSDQIPASNQELIDQAQAFAEAVDANDTTACALLANDNEKDDCYLNIAYNLADVALCSNITRYDLRTTCEDELGV